MNENLKRHRPDIKVLGEGKAIAFMPEDPMGVWVHIQEVRDLLDEKDNEIAELKEQYKDMDVTHTVHIAKMNARIEELEESLESEKASRYAESVDAGMRERRLKRALYKAIANWAKVTKIWDGSRPSDDFDKWFKVERKCRDKAEEYE